LRAGEREEKRRTSGDLRLEYGYSQRLRLDETFERKGRVDWFHSLILAAEPN